MLLLLDFPLCVIVLIDFRNYKYGGIWQWHDEELLFVVFYGMKMIIVTKKVRNI